MYFKMTNEEDVRETAQKILAYCGSHKNKIGATVLSLEGILGAGKTTLTKDIAICIGVTDTVTSPTFVIRKEYQAYHPQFEHFFHCDVYRFESPDELKAIQWSDMLQMKDTLIVVEWGNIIKQYLPPFAFRVIITIEKEERIVEFIDPHTRKDDSVTIV
ncbi:MAG: tRNA (adenosine(37)-N6)-threonylcarbamoyltransferase complex ATPase subunit type 1 TsaE [Alphaproteobacteria bacterium]|nr:tRNA (adenosine(37)-N6)-threonylcarbamoyltransferase complex ATPase subunit type 1 TsaE [Alphaproteobacteria bacterium]